jgi:hypothetical protein
VCRWRQFTINGYTYRPAISTASSSACPGGFEIANTTEERRTLIDMNDKEKKERRREEETKTKEERERFVPNRTTYACR